MKVEDRRDRRMPSVYVHSIILREIGRAHV